MRVTSLVEIFTPEQIAKQVTRIAGRINREYEGKPLVMICVLKGAFMFFSDLVRQVTARPALDFVRLSSYGASDASSGSVKLVKDVDLSLQGKHVIIVEDVVDSGLSMDFLLREFAARGASSLRLAALIDKRERREIDVHIDYLGFSLNSGFIVGYGLDYAERFRELPAIYKIESDT